MVRAIDSLILYNQNNGLDSLRRDNLIVDNLERDNLGVENPRRNNNAKNVVNNKNDRSKMLLLSGINTVYEYDDAWK